MAISDFIIGCLLAVSGLLGLFMAAGATDDGIYVFGLSLFAFACVFIIGQVRRHFDQADAARAGASGHG